MFGKAGERFRLEMAMARVRRRVDPRQFQIYELLVVQGFSMQEVKRFFNVTGIEVYVSRFRVRAEFWRQLAKLMGRAIKHLWLRMF